MSDIGLSILKQIPEIIALVNMPNRLHDACVFDPRQIKKDSPMVLSYQTDIDDVEKLALLEQVRQAQEKLHPSPPFNNDSNGSINTDERGSKVIIPDQMFNKNAAVATNF